MKRMKEFPDDIKEASVKYGLKHGWTAVARPPSQDGPRMMILNLRGNLRSFSYQEELVSEKSSKYCQHEEDFDME